MDKTILLEIKIVDAVSWKIKALSAVVWILNRIKFPFGSSKDAVINIEFKIT